jgi:hypothetical protein
VTNDLSGCDGSVHRGKKTTKKKLPAIHPGEILREEFMKPMGLSSTALAAIRPWHDANAAA